MAFVLFSAVRNEGPFLLDWVAYHHALGFDRICIVSNDCDDGSYELLQALDAFGVIDHFDQDVPKGSAPQRNAVKLINDKEYLADDDWAIFLDADEYLNIHVGENKVSDLATYLENRNLQGMLINWKLFGDGGQSSFAGTYLSDDYASCEHTSLRTQFKTFFRMGPVATGFSGELHRCRVAPGAGAMTDFITGSAKPLSESHRPRLRDCHARWLPAGEEPFSHLVGAEIGYDVAQINHYIVRDPASFALKQRRGNGFIAQDATNDRHTVDFYHLHNRNDESDVSILRHRKDTMAAKRRFKKNRKIAAAVKVVQQRYTQDIHDLGPAIAALTVERDIPLTLPEGPANLLRATYAKAEAIIEYGSGGSTLVAAEARKPCVSVESDRSWATSLNRKIKNTNGKDHSVRSFYVDIGPTGDWGFPVDQSGAQRYWQYPMRVWDSDIAPQVDTVLIDGRMRKACFAATLLNMKRPTTILFDDYAERPEYHEVEVFLKPLRYEGRMAVFAAKPDLLTTADFGRILPWFSQMA